MQQDQFVEQHELELHNEFLNEGFVIKRVNDQYFHHFRSLVGEVIVDALTRFGHEVSIDSYEQLFNSLHEYIKINDLNSFRVFVISALTKRDELRPLLYKMTRKYLDCLVGNELAMQKALNMSIQFPSDSSSLLPIHADTWSGDSPYEVVAWLPLVDCYNTKSMYILKPGPDRDLRRWLQGSKSPKSSDEVFEKVRNEISFLSVRAGEVLIFNQNLPHGNVVNLESETRVSMNCRFKNIFTPFADKKYGEFFEQITLRPVSKIGLNYTFHS